MVQKCNAYSFADMKVGMTEQFECSVTQEMQDAFTSLSGDINPMHIRELPDKARTQPFPRQ